MKEVGIGNIYFVFAKNIFLIDFFKDTIFIRNMHLIVIKKKRYTIFY